ncbi:FGGY-family carbohydrate kinase [Neolewinella agarilytica]|uniref:Sugar (Pentulose or hexulose) kinase n=1 Tax=Neolewinella agarilytica TaxID=478744 RepID=A0A1H9D8U8_9BACT|nr:FGGY family carbohydrate kinase [Neolewinella agarilytica]SEQ09198.1 Sugar (pentulose or hexulose) kinase [Neolewinella agarilytica]
MLPVTAIFDIGRTNKKFFLFDEDLREVHREYVSFPMIEDEDGFPTEDISALTTWLQEVFYRILEAETFDVQAINFSSYGASFVHLNADGDVLTPLYNYNKPLPQDLVEGFYDRFGPESDFTTHTGSNNAGMLNSGMQLYWLKNRKPEIFAQIRYSLHLPQFLSYVFTGIPISEYTSIGCHTALWDYRKKDYHDWVYEEELHRILPPIVSTETSINMNFSGKRIKIGVGVHDSSAALLPYIRSQGKPFILVSTGTWSVSLNPFAEGALSIEDQRANCINYMRIDGNPVKAARLFLGEEYKIQTQRLADHFGVEVSEHKKVKFNIATYQHILEDFRPWFHLEAIITEGPEQTVIPPGTSYEYAYHHLLEELVRLQADNIRAASGKQALKKIFVDGGFSDNDVYINLLTHHFREFKIRTTNSSLGSALGAAICISDKQLNAQFLKKNYGLKKHRPFILSLEPATTDSEQAS